MAYKRLVGVIPVRHGRVVKSYGYRFWRPAGELVTAMQNLDRWNADEIMVLDISRQAGLNPEIPRLIRKAKISTPLTFGGGIRTKDDVSRLLDAGCERFVLETLCFDQPETVRCIADVVGAQALIGSLPLVGRGHDLHIEPGYARRFASHPDQLSIDKCCRLYQELPVAELLVTAMDREGGQGTFDLVDCDGQASPFAALRKGIIWFGGLSPGLAARLLKARETIAVAFANINVERELALNAIRREVIGDPVAGTIRAGGMR
jgi:cyclase